LLDVSSTAPSLKLYVMELVMRRETSRARGAGKGPRMKGAHMATNRRPRASWSQGGRGARVRRRSALTSAAHARARRKSVGEDSNVKLGCPLPHSHWRHHEQQREGAVEETSNNTCTLSRTPASGGAVRRVLTGHKRIVADEAVELRGALAVDEQLIEEDEAVGGDQRIVGPGGDLPRLVALRGRVGKHVAILSIVAGESNSPAARARLRLSLLGGSSRMLPAPLIRLTPRAQIPSPSWWRQALCPHRLKAWECTRWRVALRSTCGARSHLKLLDSIRVS